MPHENSFSPEDAAASNPPRFVLLGGFLGAGKTTCMVSLAKWLTAKNLRCGLITNDQGEGLVDTATALSGAGGDAANAVRQVTGGCFCCRAGELGTALQELEASIRPDVFIAEPVGSCTDLVATILLPLKKIYQRELVTVTMSVVVDSRRVYDLLLGKAGPGSAGGGGFSRDVRYIYLKQLEEAEVIVLNKKDLLKPVELARLLKKLAKDWLGRMVFSVCARTGEGMDEWFPLLTDRQAAPERVIEMYYERYGTGEALLGWFNARLLLKRGPWEVDGNALLESLARNIQNRLEREGVEIAHFKMSLRSMNGSADNNDELAVVNAVRNGTPAEISRRMSGRVEEAEILINLRAEGAPALLKKIVQQEIKDLPVTWEDLAAFRPGQPVPVHRVSQTATAGEMQQTAKN